jgi:RimJ/RimL family protein N-acetyltransferase
MFGFSDSGRASVDQGSFFKRKSVLILSLVIFLAAGYAGTHWFFLSAPQGAGILKAVPEEVYGKIVTLKLLKEEYFIDIHNMFSNKIREGIEYPASWPLNRSISHLRYEMKRVKAGKVVHYCVFDNKDNKVIGTLDIRNRKATDPGQFGIWVNENYWGGGRVQEAMDLAAKVYFALKGVDEFDAEIRPWNKRSYGALTKYGFKDTGKFHHEDDDKPDRHILILRKEPRHNVLPRIKMPQE